MANNAKYTLQFDAQLNISQIKNNLATLQQSLSKLSIPDKVLNPLTKDIGKLENEIKNFEVLSSKDQLDQSGMKALLSSYERIDKLVKSISVDLKGLEGVDLSKLLPPDVLNNFQKLTELLTSIQDLSNFKTNLPQQIEALKQQAQSYDEIIQGLNKDLEDLNAKQSKAIKEKATVQGQRETLEAQRNALRKQLDKEIATPRGRESSDYLAIKERIQTLKNQVASLNVKIQGYKNILKDREEKGATQTLKYTETKNALSEVEEKRRQLLEEQKALEKEQRSLAAKKTDVTSTSEFKERQKQAEQLGKSIDELKVKEQQYDNIIKSTGKEIAAKTTELDKQEATVAAVREEIERLSNADTDTTKLDEIRQNLAQIAGVDISQVPTDLEKLKEMASQLQSGNINKVKESLGEVKVATDNLSKSEEDLTNNINEERQATEAQNAQYKEVSALKSRIQYFFGLANSINLVKRAIRGAFDTIKELDKAMTETAVVTDFSVSDMWAQLPEYTKRANELGVTTLSAYEAATLYYQQGLKTNEVAALSVETLKMARIAGLDAAEATDRMTNALRGFNMALTETNAQRVDDVYSELAANTASNVDEISTAMTKVASLAHNANMEFETTAAFLAQIIETTRESAETAGTALKTVVARFSEVKKLYSEDELRGTDEEGQVIDVNKISAALRTAGIDLNKYFLGEVGLDDIFMELASKWDSLTQVQQRYIATQAAGSRQQSRFIALMSDYARTQELVGKAYNSNGASARQFAKTQESLESKLNRLKNAWNEFLMGLTNNAVVKGAVDLLTDLLNTINNLTSAFGENAGSVAKWATVIGGIFLGKSLFKTGGLLDIILGSALSNTGIGGALSKAGILSGKTLFGSATGKAAGKVAEGAAAESAAAAAGKAAGEAAAASFAPIITAVLGVAAIFAGFTAYNEFTKASMDTFGLDKLEEKVEGMKKLAQESQEVSTQLENIRKEQDSNLNAINTATSIAAQKKTIEQQNEYIRSLIEQDAKYSQYVRTDRIGDQIILTLDEDALAEAANAAADAAVKAAVNSSFAEANFLNLQNTLLSAKAERLSESVTQKNDRYYRTPLATPSSYINPLTGEVEFFIASMPPIEIDQDEFEQIVGTVESIESEIQENNNQIRSIVTQGFEQLAQKQGLTGENATLSANLLGSVFSSTQYTQAIEAQMQNIKDEQEDVLNTNPENFFTYLEGRYFELYNQESGITDVNELLRQVAIGEYQLTQQQNLQNLSDLFDNNEIVRQIANLFVGNTNQSLYTTGSDIFGIANLLGTDTTTARKNILDLARALGYSEDSLLEFYKILKNNITLQREQQAKVTDAAQQKMWIQGMSAEQVAQYLALPNFSDQTYFNNLLTELEGSSFGQSIATAVLDSLSSGDWQGSELQTWINSLNFDNPIRGFNAIQQGANSANEQIRDLAKEIQASSDYVTTFSEVAQVQYFLLSESYSSLEEKLSELYEANGKITSVNIRELAKSNSDLNLLLENNIISAKALASIFNADFKSGGAAILNLNKSVLAAINSMDDLDGIIQQTLQDLSEFDPGYDENEVTEFISKVYKNASENIEKGAYGNNVMANYMQEIFGAFEFNGEGDYGEAYRAWLLENLKWLEANKDSMYSAWSGLANSLTTGTLELKDAEGNILKTAEIYEQNGEIFITDTTMTTEEIIQALSQQEGINEKMARMMVTDFKNYSDNFKHMMEQNDLSGAMDAWYESLPKVNGQKIYDETDISTLAKLLGVSEPEIRKQIDKLKEDHEELTGIDWTAGTGQRSPENYIKKLQELGYNLRKIGLGPDGEVIQSGWFNFDAIRQATQDAGISEEFENIFNGIVQSGETFTATINGQLQTITVEAGETATAALARVKKDLADQQLAGEFGEAVASALKDIVLNVEIDPEIDDSGTKEILSDLQQIDETTATPTINLIGNAANDVKTIWNNLITIGKSRFKTLLDIEATLYQGTSQGGSTSTSGGNTNNTSPRPTTTDALGGIVSSYASGSLRKIRPGAALTGEEDPEIVWNKNAGYAYITGENGPAFQNLQPGDRVFNADETRKILQNTNTRKILFGSFAGGNSASAYGPGSGSGGGGSSSNNKKTDWKNELDWLYDLMNDIAEFEHEQTIIQEKYELALKDLATTGRDLYELTNQELANLKAQLIAQEAAQKYRQQQLEEFNALVAAMDTFKTQKEQRAYSEYVYYNPDNNTIDIHWDEIEDLDNEEAYNQITELISQAEDIWGKMNDAEKSVLDIKKQIQALETRYLQSFIDFQNRVKDAVINKYQTSIDSLKELNDTLKDTNSSILESIQKEIDLERQIRDNTEQETQISDIEQRLAYLQRDTTGANALEIQQLQKELNDARQNYADTLLDQAVDKLSEANEESAKQRDKQIELMEAQLDYWQESGALWAEVEQLIGNGIDTIEDKLIPDSELVKILQAKESWAGLSAVQQEKWGNDLQFAINEVEAYLLQQAQTTEIQGEKIQALLMSLIQDLGGTPWHSSHEEAAWNVSVADVTRYASGGLNTYTGLAQLHGTPSEPEYVLNARQTDAFLRLADVLPEVIGTSNTVNNSYGGNLNLNITMNVDEIGSDYDVDRIVDRVKEVIYDTSSYRNINVLNFTR